MEFPIQWCWFTIDGKTSQDLSRVFPKGGRDLRKHDVALFYDSIGGELSRDAKTGTGHRRGSDKMNSRFTTPGNIRPFD